ncbi:MAG TPA: NAD(P)-dependent oxidoreductase [Candidatus Saccharimonadales bacterium]|nr:NAD(P)-dependent oxidoreductase [Candidatus Saccharimonadales bacterium]
MFDDAQKTAEFFKAVTEEMPVASSVCVVVVTQMVKGRDIFVDALAKIVRVCAVIPKPDSIDPTTLAIVSKTHNVLRYTRTQCSNAALMQATLEKLVKPEEQLAVLDMGGYFSPIVNKLVIHGKSIAVVVEDTENGEQRWRKLTQLPCPVLSGARSELKEPEDLLIGQSVVFSEEAVLRTGDMIFANKKILIFGFGKIGKSVAESLGRRAFPIQVWDIDPIREVFALAHGYLPILDIDQALAEADLIFCCTGNKSLTRESYPKLKKRACVSTVTSADDELDWEGLHLDYEELKETEYISRFQSKTSDHFFYLFNRGRAINFLHGASVGSYIALIQAELLKALQYGFEHHDVLLHEVQQLPREEKATIARKWLEVFVGRKK